MSVTFKDWLKQFTAVCIAVVTLISSITVVNAEDYVSSSSSNDSTYYIIEGKSVDKLFDFSIADVPNIVSWVFNFKTYTVIKKYEEKNDQNNNETVYKMYFNTPNLQAILKNKVVSLVSDGYTDDTYKVADTEWLVPVGDNAESENVITKYGFAIPSYTYMGEYPKEVMSVAGVLPSPKKWYESLWRAIKALFGASFLKAPDANNFNTITYLNHTYTDRSDYILEFFKKYYLEYFERKIPTVTIMSPNEDGDIVEMEYFNDAQHVIDLTVTEDSKKAAEAYNNKYSKEYEEACNRYDYWSMHNNYYNDYDIFLNADPEIFTNEFDESRHTYDPYHFVTNISRYRDKVKSWATGHPLQTYIMLNAITEAEQGLLRQYTSDPSTSAAQITSGDILRKPEDYGSSQNSFTIKDDGWNVSAAMADMLKYAKKDITAHVTHDIYERTATTTTKSKVATKKVTTVTKTEKVYLNDVLVGVTETKEDPVEETIINASPTVETSTSGGTWQLKQSNIAEDMSYDEVPYEGYENISLGNAEESSSKSTTTENSSNTKNDITTEDKSIQLPPSIVIPMIFKTETTTKTEVETTYETTTTVSKSTDTKESNYKLAYLWDGINNDNQMSDADFKDFFDKCNLKVVNYIEDDFVPPMFQTVYKNYLANEDLIDKYNTFIKYLSRGQDSDANKELPEILYRQCMITNQGEENECWSKKYGDDKTSLTLLNVYAYSGIYKITENYSDSTTTLSDADAHKILVTLQSYCGPYYTEVLTNMMKLMCATAKNDGVKTPTQELESDDPRVMPYDTSSMMTIDRQNYSVDDPRVELYKSHIIGGLISSFKLNILGISIYIKPQKAIIGLAGKVTELSVFMQQLCNFDTLDNFGLSPAKMWSSALVTLMIGLLALFFVIKTVIAVFKLGTKGGVSVIAGFLILFLELGIITAIAADPDNTWEKVKNIETNIMNLGEMSTVYNNNSLTYLYGDATDFEVSYYMPYLDTWSKYNTGYGILDKEQEINEDDIELKNIYMPKIGSNDIKHWSVLLMDSFSYYGVSNSVTNTITEGGTTYNGNNINNNAYRAVDHFMAPRVAINDSGNIAISVTENENFNGEFQSGFVDLLVKLLNCCLICFLSLIKVLTFMWLWFVMYIFIFKVILGKGAEGKSMAQILLETFSPLICLIMIGLYAGIVMTLGMTASGIFGILLELFLFWLTAMLIRWWHNLSNQRYFPKTLVWVYMLTNMSQHTRMRNQERLNIESRQHATDSGDTLTDEEITHFDKRTEHYFNEDGTLRSQYAEDPRYNRSLEDWYRFAQNSRNNGREWTEAERRAIQTFEANEKYKDIVDRVRNRKTRRNKQYKKIKHEEGGEDEKK